jgi:hypothetical protein
MKIVVFDLDETLGYFTEFGIFWDSLVKYRKSIGRPLLTQNDFNEILDLYPEFLRPNIINVLNYLKAKKKSLCCNKMMLYTNNNGPREWAQNIIKYFEKKVNNYKLFDQIIAAFKINGKQVEICRTTYDKTHNDFIKCTKLPSNAEICFLDDTFYPGMANEFIYYINVKPYYYDLKFAEMIKRFLNSNISNKLVDIDDFQQKITNILDSYKYDYVYKEPKEYELDEIIGKQIVSHLQTFFNDKVKRNKTNRKRNTSQKNKTQRRTIY